MTALALYNSTNTHENNHRLQSLNVNGGHYRAAFFTSIGIGVSNLFLFKLAPDAAGIEIAAFLLGGPFGIVSSMRFHRYIRGRFGR